MATEELAPVEVESNNDFRPVYYDKPPRAKRRKKEDQSTTSGSSSTRVSKGRGKNLTNDQREEIAKVLLAEDVVRKVKRDFMQTVADDYDISLNSIIRLWKQIEEQKNKNNNNNNNNRISTKDINVKSKMTNCGRKKKDWSKHLEKICEIDWKKRTTLRSLEAATGVPKTVLLKFVHEGTLKRVTCSFEPTYKPKPPTKKKVKRLIDHYQLRCKHERTSGIFYNPDNLDDLLQIIENFCNQASMKPASDNYQTPPSIQLTPHLNNNHKSTTTTTTTTKTTTTKTTNDQINSPKLPDINLSTELPDINLTPKLPAMGIHIGTDIGTDMNI